MEVDESLLPSKEERAAIQKRLSDAVRTSNFKLPELELPPISEEEFRFNCFKLEEYEDEKPAVITNTSEVVVSPFEKKNGTQDQFNRCKKEEKEEEKQDQFN